MLAYLERQSNAMNGSGISALFSYQRGMLYQVQKVNAVYGTVTFVSGHA
jgi:hypothetical protein